MTLLDTKNLDVSAESAAQQSNQGLDKIEHQQKLPQWVVDHFDQLLQNEPPKTLKPFPCSQPVVCIQNFQTSLELFEYDSTPI